MLKRIKHLLASNSIYLAIIITVAIAVLSLAKLGKQPISFPFIDKVQHAFAYFVLTFFWLTALGKTKNRKIIIVLLCVFYGIIIEVLQVTLTSYRFAEYLDALANCTGAIIALLIFNYFFEKKQSI